MHGELATIVLVVMAAITGLLAGASLDQSIKQLPARHRIGAAAFSRYSQAADLANGIALYAILGVGTLVLNLAAAMLAYAQALPPGVAVYGGAVAAILHSAVTARAAPLNFRQRSATDEATLAAILDRFARLQALRCILQAANFGLSLWALGAV